MPSRLLLVAYHFPPIAGSGVQRALKLAKYWPDCGFEIHVLTAGHSHYPLIDESLCREIPANVMVHRVRGFDPGGLARRVAPQSGLSQPGKIEQRIYWRLQAAADRFAMPEPESWWVGSAVRAARRLARRFSFDAVVTTSPPHSGQRIGSALRSALGLPWIADLRDPIVDNFAYAPKTPAVDRYWRRLERDVVENADRVIVTCPDYADALAEKYAFAASRIDCVTNGYDEADRPTIHRRLASARFVLAHVGAFYHSQSVEPLLSACRALRSRREDVAAAFQLRLVGSLSRNQLNYLNADDRSFVVQSGYERHASAVAGIAEADAVFLMTPEHRNGRNCIPAKLFEYLAFGQRVVALAHTGSTVHQILQAAGATDIAFHDKSQSLPAAIERAFDDWQRRHAPPLLKQDVIREYARDRLASRYATIIRSTMAHSVQRDHVARELPA